MLQRDKKPISDEPMDLPYYIMTLIEEIQLSSGYFCVKIGTKSFRSLLHFCRSSSGIRTNRLTLSSPKHKFSNSAEVICCAYVGISETI